MKHKVFIAAVALAAVAVTGTVAIAQQGGQRHHAAFEDIDADGNGQITREEMAAMGMARMQGIDTDGDGFLSKAEIMAEGQKHVERRADRMIEHLDSDKDGKISTQEIADAPRAGRMFDRVDADGDGAVSKAEFDEAHDGMGRHHGMRHGFGKRN